MHKSVDLYEQEVGGLRLRLLKVLSLEGKRDTAQMSDSLGALLAYNDSLRSSIEDWLRTPENKCVVDAEAENISRVLNRLSEVYLATVNAAHLLGVPINYQ